MYQEAELFTGGWRDPRYFGLLTVKCVHTLYSSEDGSFLTKIEI